MHGRDFSYAQDDVNLHSLRMLKGTFSLDAGQVINYAPEDRTKITPHPGTQSIAKNEQ